MNSPKLHDQIMIIGRNAELGCLEVDLKLAEKYKEMANKTHIYVSFEPNGEIDRSSDRIKRSNAITDNAKTVRAYSTKELYVAMCNNMSEELEQKLSGIAQKLKCKLSCSYYRSDGSLNVFFEGNTEVINALTEDEIKTLF